MSIGVDPQYVAKSPEGPQVTISQEVFEVLQLMLDRSTNTGRIEIDVRRGGIAGVRVTRVFK